MSINSAMQHICTMIKKGGNTLPQDFDPNVEIPKLVGRHIKSFETEVLAIAGGVTEEGTRAVRLYTNRVARKLSTLAPIHIRVDAEEKFTVAASMLNKKTFVFGVAKRSTREHTKKTVVDHVKADGTVETKTLRTRVMADEPKPSTGVSIALRRLIEQSIQT